MSEKRPFTISSFYQFITENTLMTAQCNECGTVSLPPKPMCCNCLSLNLKWTKLNSKGKLVSYTVIHIAPKQFESLTPYTIGIVEFKPGLRLPGMIRDVPFKELTIGMNLKICFETSIPDQWPTWSRYAFKPV